MTYDWNMEPVQACTTFLLLSGDLVRLSSFEYGISRHSYPVKKSQLFLDEAD